MANLILEFNDMELVTTDSGQSFEYRQTVYPENPFGPKAYTGKITMLPSTPSAYTSAFLFIGKQKLKLSGRRAFFNINQPNTTTVDNFIVPLNNGLTLVTKKINSFSENPKFTFEVDYEDFGIVRAIKQNITNFFWSVSNVFRINTP